MAAIRFSLWDTSSIVHLTSTRCFGHLLQYILFWPMFLLLTGQYSAAFWTSSDFNDLQQDPSVVLAGGPGLC